MTGALPCALAALFAALPQAADEPLRNSVPLPADRAVEELLLQGDTAFAEHRSGGDDADLRAAFDLWQEALGTAPVGAGVRLVVDGGPEDLFPDPGGTAPRRSEGPAEGVVRRLASLPPAVRARWGERFAPAADAALAGALDQLRADASVTARPPGARLAEVERRFPLTEAAARAALLAADLALEEGRPAAAATWLRRATRHLGLTGALERTDAAVFARALGRRRDAVERGLSRARGIDHASRRPVAADAAPYRGLRPETSHRIIGLGRAAVDPLGRGLGSGLAVLGTGAILAQSAYGVLYLPAGEAAQAIRMRTHEALGVARVPMRATARSGGWSSLPATDGHAWALVVGRANRPQPLLDVAVAPIGNVLGLVVPGPANRPLTPRWALRDGLMIPDPARAGEEEIDPSRPAPLGDGIPVEGWTFGRGWEFQPGPVMADGAVFALMRGLGDPTDEASSHTDEIRLVAIEADGRAVRWSRSITKERGTPEELGRGEASLFAATTMPLGFDPASGVLLTGTNVGLICAHDVADGRLLWALRTQRAEAGDPGWPGSATPLIQPGGRRASGSPIAWLTPQGSAYAYAVPAGPQGLDGTLLPESPRKRGEAEVLAGAFAGAADVPSTLALLGREGRFDAVLLDGPGARAGGPTRRTAASYLAPQDRIAGLPAFARGVLLVPGEREISVLDPARGWRLVDAVSVESRGAGRGGSLTVAGDRLLAVGRDTLWIYRFDD